MIHTRVYRNKYSNLDESTLIDIILDREDTIKELQEELKGYKQERNIFTKTIEQLQRQLKYLRSGEYLNQVKWERDYNEKLVEDYSTKLRHIEQYFDDLDDIDYKTIKKEVENICKKK